MRTHHNRRRQSELLRDAGDQRSDRVVVITRLRLAGGKPLAVERSTLPAGRFSDIEDMDLSGSLYELMEVGFADGCTGSCVTGGTNTRTAYPTIARQSSA